MNQTERIDVCATFADDGTMQLRLSDRGGHGYADVRVLEASADRLVMLYREWLHERERNNPDMSPEQCRDAVLWYLFDTYAPPFEEMNQ